MRRDELAAISGPNEFAEFYNRLKQIKEFHRKHPHEVDNVSGLIEPCDVCETEATTRSPVCCRFPSPCPLSLRS